MELSNEYKSRCGVADFKNLYFGITSKKKSNVDCKLLKVPTYIRKHSYHERICDSDGWYIKGDKITEYITYDSYWLVILDSKCLGVVDEKSKSEYNSKFKIEDVTSAKIIKFIESLPISID